jgi:hypothetical protein
LKLDGGFSFKLDKRNQHSQYIITRETDFYLNNNGYTFGYQVNKMDTNSTSENERCLIYVAGIEQGRELILNEGVPHIFTLQNSDSKEFSYVYPHVYESNVAIISIYFNRPGRVSLRYRVGTSNETELHLYKPYSIMINKETLDKYCIT